MDKIICVGKNYLEHARELGDAIPERPVLFLKPASSLLLASAGSTTTNRVVLPREKGSVHFECEIVVKLDGSGNITAVTLGLDLTLRDLQAELKKKGHPWEIAKVFKNSAVIGPWMELSQCRDYLEQEFSFVLDGQTKQLGMGKQMRMLPEVCIAYAGEYFPLVSGDLIFTGTPAGVGPVVPGQKGKLLWGGKTLYEVQFVDE